MGIDFKLFSHYLTLIIPTSTLRNIARGVPGSVEDITAPKAKTSRNEKFGMIRRVEAAKKRHPMVVNEIYNQSICATELKKI